MFQGVHHVTYLVWDLDSVEEYFREHFGLDPLKRDDGVPGRSVSYEIGQTMLRFSQPGRTASAEYELLRRFGGPVISHIGLVVRDLTESAQQLRAGGVDFTQPGVTVSPHGGYELIDIAPEGSCGMRIQNESFSLRRMFPDSRVGIRLQLCEDIPQAQEVRNAQ